MEIDVQLKKYIMMKIVLNLVQQLEGEAEHHHINKIMIKMLHVML